MRLQLDTKKLARVMKLANINQSELARRIGVSRQLLSYWIATKRVQSAEKIAPAFGLKPKDLVQ